MTPHPPTSLPPFQNEKREGTLGQSTGGQASERCRRSSRASGCPGRGGLPPRTPQDADEFLENVDEVNALIDGLRSGKISAEYVDRKIKERDAESTQLEEERKKEAEEAERRKYENLSPEEQKKIKAKVDEMIAEKERRERARKAFHEYRAKMPEDKRRATDYDAWDLWTPSDDEDDPWMQYTPENPAFKAMEADIDREARRAGAREADGASQARGGQRRFSRRAFADALRCYELGLEADKRSLELHGNAAMAALKCEMFVQCIDHASKACELAEFLLLERPDHPTAIKCLQRRAAARLKLSHYKDALNDLSLAHERDPSNGEIESQMKEANATYEEARKEKEVERGMRRAAQGIDGEVDGTDFHTLRELEKLCGEIGSGACDYARLEALVEGSEQCRVFLRSGRGSHLLGLSRELELAAAPTGPLRVLRAACLNEANRETLARNGTLKLAVGFIARGAAFNRGGDRPRGCFCCAVSAAHVLGDGQPQGVDHRGSRVGRRARRSHRGAVRDARHGSRERRGRQARRGSRAVPLGQLRRGREGEDRAYESRRRRRAGKDRARASMRDARARGTRGDVAGKHVRGRPDARRVCGERAGHLGPMRAPPKKREKREGDGVAAGMGAGLPGLGARGADKESDAPIDPSPVRDCELVLNVLAALANVSVDAAAASTIGGAGAAAAARRARSRVRSARRGARGDGALPHRARPVHGAAHVRRGAQRCGLKRWDVGSNGDVGSKRGCGRGDGGKVCGSEARV